MKYPWINDKIRQLIKKRDNLGRQAKKCNKPELKEKVEF